MKTCSQCNEIKDLDEFYKKGTGHRTECKDCFKMRIKVYQQTNPDKMKQYRNKSYIKNEKNPEYELKRKIYKNQPHVKKQRNETKKKYYQENREKILAQNKKNRKKINLYEKNRRASDLNYRLLCTLRSRLNTALKEKCKHETTKDLLGCSIVFFKNWIEYQFSEDMSWENYGSYWQLDHVKPCASFDLTNLDKQKECFEWKNISPLNKLENITKSDKWQEDTISQQKIKVEEFLKSINQ